MLGLVRMDAPDVVELGVVSDIACFNSKVSALRYEESLGLVSAMCLLRIGTKSRPRLEFRGAP